MSEINTAGHMHDSAYEAARDSYIEQRRNNLVFRVVYMDYPFASLETKVDSVKLVELIADLEYRLSMLDQRGPRS